MYYHKLLILYSWINIITTLSTKHFVANKQGKIPCHHNMLGFVETGRLVNFKDGFHKTKWRKLIDVMECLAPFHLKLCQYFHKYYFVYAKCSSEFASCMLLPTPWPHCTQHFALAHSFAGQIPKANVHQYHYSFILFAGKHWSSLPLSCPWLTKFGPQPFTAI